MMTPTDKLTQLLAIQKTGKGDRTTFQHHIAGTGSEWMAYFASLNGNKTVTPTIIAAEIAKLQAPQSPPAPAPTPVAPTPVPTPQPAPAPVTMRIIPDATSVMWQGVKLGSQCPGKLYSLQLFSDGEERYEIRADEHCSNDGKGTAKRRSELSGLVTKDQGLISFDYDLMIEEAPFTDDVQYVFGQLHKGKAANGITGDHPILAFRIVHGGFPGLTVCGSNAYPLTAADVTKADSVTAWTGKTRFPFDKRVHISIRAMQGGADQWAELWIDGVCQVHYKGTLGYKNPEAPPYFKRGIYNAQASKQTTVAHYWNVKAG